MTEPPAPRFIGAFPRADVSLDPPLSEVAFIGRSNVGKSSLINALLGRRVARISGTPGKTRALNVYLIPESSRWSHAFYLLDLPGYGYARASKTERAAFANLVRHVVTRPRLTGIVWLLDIRHDPSAGDRDMQDLLAGAETRVLAAATKSDKLSRTRRVEQARALQQTLGLDDDQLVVTSAETREGLDELREAVAALVS
ncbi:MAG TPA: ribosome biogenesis GTP-binding protein YihA/YsxC [Gemmatimonadales bacterium]|nr:ribosome biogenesis GTP-binding protein YihA/YsxC [Gemmatimonadales bacterium]